MLTLGRRVLVLVGIMNMMMFDGDVDEDDYAADAGDDNGF